MLENLKQLVEENAGDAIINNPAIPNEKNEEAINEASASIFSGLKNAAQNGNLSEITNMFQGGEHALNNSPVVQNIQGGFIDKLKHKFGLDHGVASSVAGMLIPAVLQKFIRKTNDPQDKSFDLNSIIKSVTGGANAGSDESGGGILDKVKGLFK
jgi:hypothetical protein